MTPDDSTDSQLDTLRDRWESDPSPHLSLQLADLYRQHGRLPDALPVLERGLAEHPGHVSVRVALGRYRLEGGDAEGAEEVLLAVVEEDPAHLVANKSLVRTYVALGDPQRAADRLDLYAVLNDSDPDLETLRAAMTESVSGPVPDEPTAEPVAEAGASSGPPVDLRRVEAPGPRQLCGAVERFPFGELLAAPLEPFPLAELFGSSEEPAEEALEPPAEPAFGIDDEPSAEFVDRLIESEPEPEGAFHEGAEAPEPASTEEPAADPPPTEVDRGSGATSTLGALYLGQDHLEDAEATFQQVLRRDPEDAEARAGLAEVARRRAAADDAKAPIAAANRRSGRKIELLEDYLGRIRRAAGRLSA